MRIGISLFGVLQVMTSFLIVWEISQSLSAAYVTALLIVCDSAAHAYNRLVLLDPILLWFILQSTYSSIKFSSCADRPFAVHWWLWLLVTGVFLGLSLAVKHVGMFVILLVGLRAVHDLWQLYCDTSVSLMNVIKHFLARCFCLILVPILLYMSTFVLHLHLLDKGADTPDIGLYSAQFRLSFSDHAISRHTPPVVTDGSRVTLLSGARARGYLATSYDTYPDEFGAETQVVALDAFLDDLNGWMFTRTDERQLVNPASPDYASQAVAHGDVVRLITCSLSVTYMSTGCQLPSHRTSTWSPASDSQDELHAGGVWHVLLDDPGASFGVTPLRTVGSWFRLVNNSTGCALRPGFSKYPGWGFDGWEVVCDPKGVNLEDTEQLWQIDENVNARVEGADLKAQYEMSTLAKIIEMQPVMLVSNSQFKDHQVGREDSLQKLFSSSPWMWPILYKGCACPVTQVHAMYFVGSPHVYFPNLAILCALPLLETSVNASRKDCCICCWPGYSITLLSGRCDGGSTFITTCRPFSSAP
ncbi:protein O-mannosyl-transferase 2-like isoform X2 [Pollicipes pollicipes]|uniref:protein O-mannosyl-transferase 2-like isoform X2 n=1 Tax=Pollicipes pollicipes TaxID=41117 RepID=UPI0018857818|nr:protein O-mannosyl-transferase 2-like isoform X2 [Pollicipes pollicipes]